MAKTNRDQGYNIGLKFPLGYRPSWRLALAGANRSEQKKKKKKMATIHRVRIIKLCEYDTHVTYRTEGKLSL